jgi:hypothetical protein
MFFEVFAKGGLIGEMDILGYTGYAYIVVS